ncbi:hypothetical protein Echvi_1638 [Echinicola vietnamensis DSM 17526]|uniref:Uncharacterized protein n=1 Tax=Echinicola vietnamensis (strain DSM 17526 / LMG 23754 / KMM 6221) TaxID=926556 RepID=L0FXX4_ECHVK|nr:hypothetical protein Echvi_1638 [Echinicola vietnamensis DSM 17526]
MNAFVSIIIQQAFSLLLISRVKLKNTLHKSVLCYTEEHTFKANQKFLP